MSNPDAVYAGDTGDRSYALTYNGTPVDVSGVTAHRLVATALLVQGVAYDSHVSLSHGISTGTVTWHRVANDLAIGRWQLVAELTDSTGIHTYPDPQDGPLIVDVLEDPAP